MHKSVILLAALAASGLMAETAQAKTWSIGFVSQSALAAACKAQPGAVSYTQGSGVYGCVGKNTVQCDANTKTCTASTPGRTAPGDSVTGVLTGKAVVGSKPSKPGVLGTGILQTGPVFGSQGPAATGSPMGSGAPAAPPVIIR